MTEKLAVIVPTMKSCWAQPVNENGKKPKMYWQSLWALTYNFLWKHRKSSWEIRTPQTRRTIINPTSAFLFPSCLVPFSPFLFFLLLPSSQLSYLPTPKTRFFLSAVFCDEPTLSEWKQSQEYQLGVQGHQL